MQKNSKIKAHELLLSFFGLIGQGDASYASWASSLGSLIGQTISKQAICQRMNAKWVVLMKLLVVHALEKYVTNQKSTKLCSLFNNIYIQDSTTISLPDILKWIFPGNVSKGKQKALAKINAVINLTSGVCCHFGITGFTTNEQSLSDSILGIAKAGDLVIRDLGYFALEVFEKMRVENIYYISRLRYGVHLLKDGVPIDMLKLLNNKQQVDVMISCGAKEQLPTRLVAIKLSHEQASERIRKAKKSRDKRLNHSKEYYKLLQYIIFITNVESEKCNAREISELYRIRWRIEILFKSWKSGIKIEKLIPDAIKKTERIESILYMFILYLTWFEQKIVAPLKLEKLSILKLTKEIAKNIYYYMFRGLGNKTIKDLIYKCSYETRTRPNANKWLDEFIDGFD